MMRARGALVPVMLLCLSVGRVSAQSGGAGGTATGSGGTAGQPSDTTGPTAIRYKGIRITPFGFFALEAVYRQRALGADMLTAFNAIPFPRSAAGQVREFKVSARHSRIGMLGEGTAGRVRLSGMFETDFLSAGTSSNSNENNSYTLRVRQIWGQAVFSNNVSVTAGQMWSLLTPGRSGIATRAEYLPAVIDAQYTVGFDWARQAALRVTARPGPRIWVAVALEEPQTTFLARGTPDRPFLLGQAGGSTLNQLANYSYDAGPDLIGKVAFEAGPGHYEVKAVGRIFRDRIYTPASGGGAAVASARNYSTAGGGIGASALWGIARRRVELGLNGLWGRGIGRYGSSQLPDASARADGRIVPIRAAHGLGTLEVHPTPRFDAYAYGGVEYAERTADVTAAGQGFGYGSPRFDNSACNTEVAPGGVFAPGAAPCNADTRAVAEGAVGTWYRFYRGQAGTVQWGLQYLYVARRTWAATAAGRSAEPKTGSHMAFTSFRYVLP
jgi:hypothetical protein